MKVSERLLRENGRDYALRVIKDNIIHLGLEPGSQISENELAAELGLSRAPVREALIELSKVRIIEIRPQKRSVISLIDYDMVEEARFMRNVLECAVVELVCGKIQAKDVERLRENVQLQNFYLENFNPDKLWSLDDDFHQILFEAARKPQVYSLMHNITIHFDRVRNMSLSTIKDLKIVQDHEDICDAVEQGDAEKARALMEVHLNRYKIDAKAIQEAYPQYFLKKT